MTTKGRSIETLAPHLVLADGSPIPFEEQVAAYAYGEMPTGDMFVVSTNAVEAGVPEAGALPILMKQKTIRKVQADHEIALAEIEKLPIWLEDHPLAMESITEENGLVIVADARDKRGNDIIVAMHLGIERQRVEINEIASVYGKKNLAYLIENTVNLGKGVYANEKTGDWILRTGLQLPEQIANRLCYQYTPSRASEQRALDPPVEECSERQRRDAPRTGTALRDQGSKCELAAGQIDKERGGRGPLPRDSDERTGGGHA